MNDEARMDATLSNAFVGGGLGLLAVGLVVLLAAPSDAEQSDAAAIVVPSVGPRGGTLTARLVW